MINTASTSDALLYSIQSEKCVSVLRLLHALHNKQVGASAMKTENNYLSFSLMRFILNILPMLQNMEMKKQQLSNSKCIGKTVLSFSNCTLRVGIINKCIYCLLCLVVVFL